MKIRKGFVLREIADSIVVVPTGDLMKEFKGMINLNATGKFIWELLQEEMTIDQVADKLMERYGIDQEKAKQGAENFAKKLKEANVLEA